jgi:tyrosine-protein kinase Etk/Wzc
MTLIPFDRRAAPQPSIVDVRAHEPEPGDFFGLRSAVDSALSNAKLALSVFIVVMTAALAYALLAAPTYKADSVLRIDNRVRDSLAPPALTPASERGSTEALKVNVAGESEIMASREVFLPVMVGVGADVELGMGFRFGWLPVGGRHGITVPIFQVPAKQHGKLFSLKVASGRWTLADSAGVEVAQGRTEQKSEFNIDGGQGRILVQADSDAQDVRLSIQQMQSLKAYEVAVKRLRIVELTRDSGVLRLSYEDNNAARAANLLNGLVQAYLDHTVARKAEDGAQALRFVEAQLPQLAEQLEKSERALAEYQRANHAAPLNMESDALLRQRSDLERQSVELQIKRDQLSVHLTPAHPEMSSVMKQLATVQSALGRLSGQAERLPGQNRELASLQREVQAHSQLYTSALAHAQHMRMADRGWLANAQQIDRAVAPTEPLRPQRMAVLSVGAGMGLALALLAALAAQALKPTVTGPHELISNIAPPTLAVIPDSPAQKRLMSGRMQDGLLSEMGTHLLLARAAPEDPAVESLHTLYMGLVMRNSQTPNKVILVTSPKAGTGKTFIAANLAAVMAESGRRVLLIETDLHKTGVQRLVSIYGAPGLTDLLAGKRALNEVIQEHPSAGFDVILQGNRTRKLAALLMSPQMDAAMEELRKRYDYIVINGAPITPSRDALVVGRHADLALMVVRAEQSLLGETRTALRHLQRSGIKVEGLLFNGVKRNRLNAPVVS